MYTLDKDNDKTAPLIPTRPTEEIDHDLYICLYKVVDSELIDKKEYLRLPLSYLFFNPCNMYDADEEDYEWLHKRPYITIKEFESVIETLENESTDSSLCLPGTAEDILKDMTPGIVGEVYDLWLNKRAECNKKGLSSLMPKVKTDCSKEGLNSVNPYICFRKRHEKMQTRRSKKCEEGNYIKMLYLKNNMKIFDKLLKKMEKREKLKYRIIEENENIFNMRLSFNLESQNIISKENLPKSTIVSYVMNSIMSDIDEYTRKIDIKTKKIRDGKKRQSLIWDKYVKSINCKKIKRDIPINIRERNLVEVNLDDSDSSDEETNGNVKEDFEFRRKRGVTYRAPISDMMKPDSYIYNEIPFYGGALNHRDRFYPFTFSSKINGQTLTRMIRKVQGRLGQTFFEYISDDYNKDLPKNLFAVHNKESQINLDLSPS